MKATGIVRKVDELGRIVIPIEIRRGMSIDEKDPIEIFVEDDRIILKKSGAACIFCGSGDTVVEFGGKYVCKACVEQLKQA